MMSMHGNTDLQKITNSYPLIQLEVTPRVLDSKEWQSSCSYKIIPHPHKLSSDLSGMGKTDSDKEKKLLETTKVIMVNQCKTPPLPAW